MGQEVKMGLTYPLTCVATAHETYYESQPLENTSRVSTNKSEKAEVGV